MPVISTRFPFPNILTNPSGAVIDCAATFGEGMACHELIVTSSTPTTIQTSSVLTTPVLRMDPDFMENLSLSGVTTFTMPSTTTFTGSNINFANTLTIWTTSSFNANFTGTTATVPPSSVLVVTGGSLKLTGTSTLQAPTVYVDSNVSFVNGSFTGTCSATDSVSVSNLTASTLSSLSASVSGSVLASNSCICSDFLYLVSATDIPADMPMTSTAPVVPTALQWSDMFGLQYLQSNATLPATNSMLSNEHSEFVVSNTGSSNITVGGQVIKPSTSTEIITHKHSDGSTSVYSTKKISEPSMQVYVDDLTVVGSFSATTLTTPLINASNVNSSNITTSNMSVLSDVSVGTTLTTVSQNVIETTGRLTLDPTHKLTMTQVAISSNITLGSTHLKVGTLLTVASPATQLTIPSASTLAGLLSGEVSTIYVRNNTGSSLSIATSDVPANLTAIPSGSIYQFYISAIGVYATTPRDHVPYV